MADGRSARCRYIRQYAFLSCQSEMPFLSVRHRASGARRWIVAACFLTLIFWYRASFGRILTVYCDRDHKSPPAFKLLQFDSGSFYLYFFLFFTLSVCHLCFNRNVLEISRNSTRFSNLAISRIVTVKRTWQVILCSESIGRSRPSNGYPHYSNRFIIVSLTFFHSVYHKDGPQITKLQYLPLIASLQRPINSQQRIFDAYPLC